jgi:hypothetical protein
MENAVVAERLVNFVDALRKVSLNDQLRDGHSLLRAGIPNNSILD